VAQTDAGERTFRVSRVLSVERTAEPVLRPEGFDLAAAWRDIVTAVDEKRAPVMALVRTDAGTHDELRYVFGNRMVRVVAQTSTEVEIEIRGHSDASLAEQLAGFGPSVEVLSPEGVRTRLAVIGRSLMERYGDGAAPTTDSC
jgi:predicted DNA-binding transcriptional regulator YafY